MDRDKLTNDIIRASGIHKSRIFNIFLFGSRIYGTFNKKSDWDVIMVANNSVESSEIRNGLFNIHVYTPKIWIGIELTILSAFTHLIGLS